ncbi:MAG: VCBS repeat-containing protein, partial [Ginsengibacter sp.]
MLKIKLSRIKPVYLTGNRSRESINYGLFFSNTQFLNIVPAYCFKIKFAGNLLMLLFSFSYSNAQQKIETLPNLQIVKYNNPGAIADLGVGLWAQPFPMDFDNDGKMDLVISCSGVPDNGIYFFKNSSGGKLPVFEKGIWLSEGL